MKTKLLFTIACIFFLFSTQVFSSMSFELNQNTEMQSETQFANGKMLTVKVHSQGIANNKLGDTEYRKVSVYLPPGYDQNGTASYPVIYMLSDVNGTNEGWAQLSPNANLMEIIDKLIKSGGIKPMIMVFPDGKNKLGGCWYTNSPVTGNWEDFVVNDVVKYIDQNYRTLPFAVSRGIAGKGMGGYGALKLATKHPDVFSTVYSLNALVDFETIISHEYIWKSNFTNALQAKGYPVDDAFANQLLAMAVAFSPDMFNPTKGKLPKTESGEIVASVRQQWLEQDPLYMINANSENLKSLKAITVDCSNSDVGIMLNSNYSEALKSQNIKHTFAYFNGTETDALLKRVTNVLLPVFSKNLAHSLLELNAKPFYINSEILKARMISDGSIYIVQKETELKLASIEENKIIKLDVTANSFNEIPLTNLSKGIYKIYGVSSSGFIGKPHEFGLNGGIPQIKICVTDSHCGDKIKTCGVNINGKCYTTDANGELCIPENEFPKDGKATICMQKENYSGLTKSVTILTDTTLRYTLVRDSYVQVIERGTGMPVFEAMVTHENVANLTGSNGFATVHNLRDGVLDCRIFKPGYFTETCNTILEPGKSAVVTLTPKKADVNFILVGNEGHLQDGKFKFGGVNLKPDQYGRVTLTDIDARREYTYSFENASYEVVMGTLFIEADTTVAILLQPKDVVDLKLKDGQLTTGSRIINESEILIYPNPAKNSLTVQINEIKGFIVELRTETGALLYKTKTEGTLQQINLSNLSNGVYFVTVKSDNFYHTRKIMKL